MSDLINTLDNNNEFQNYKWVSQTSCDYFLKFANEAEANDVLNPEVTTITTSYDEEGNATDTITTERKPIEGYSIDIIGVLYDIVDEEPVALDGWHVNLRGAEANIFDAYKVEPVVPRRVFA